MLLRIVRVDRLCVHLDLLYAIYVVNVLRMLKVNEIYDIIESSESSCVPKLWIQSLGFGLFVDVSLNVPLRF